MNAQSSILGTFPVERFIRDHWQKTHLFLPRALPDFTSPLSPDELAGLACEDSVEARLVTHANEAHERPWRLKTEIDEDVFSSLGERDWTLLVQDVDKFVPAVHALLSLVDFLPRWSVDDIMISYAAPGASVGPHTDRYDVFLVQAQGTRSWSVSSRNKDESLRQDAELKVLAEFEAEETFEAQPGDVLYLPPGVAHYGIASSDCLTYSFGFRAPTESALVSAFADELAAGAGDAQLREELVGPVAQPARIDDAVVLAARQMVERRLREISADSRFLGRYLTEAKPHLSPEPAEETWNRAKLERAFDEGAALVPSGASRFLYAEDAGRVILFVDGEDYDCGPTQTASGLVELFCGGAPIGADALSGLSDTDVGWALLLQLIQAGSLVFGSD